MSQSDAGMFKCTAGGCSHVSGADPMLPIDFIGRAPLIYWVKTQGGEKKRRMADVLCLLLLSAPLSPNKVTPHSPQPKQTHRARAEKNRQERPPSSFPIQIPHQKSFPLSHSPSPTLFPHTKIPHTKSAHPKILTAHQPLHTIIIC